LDKIENRSYTEKQINRGFSIYLYKNRTVIFVKNSITEKDLLDAIELRLAGNAITILGTRDNKIYFEYYNIKKNNLGETVSYIITKDLRNLKIEIK